MAGATKIKYSQYAIGEILRLTKTTAGVKKDDTVIVVDNAKETRNGKKYAIVVAPYSTTNPVSVADLNSGYIKNSSFAVQTKYLQR